MATWFIPLRFQFQSTLSVRRATGWNDAVSLFALISIHALRKESDMIRYGTFTLSILFQSTLSVRRATRGAAFDGLAAQNFNPRSP